MEQVALERHLGEIDDQGYSIVHDAIDPELYYQVDGAAVLFVTRSPDGPLLSW